MWENLDCDRYEVRCWNGVIGCHTGYAGYAVTVWQLLCVGGARGVLSAST